MSARSQLSTQDDMLATRLLQETLSRQIELLYLSHDAIIATDPFKVVTGWNKAAEELYGWTEADALGKITHELLRTRSTVGNAGLEEILFREGRWEGELIHTARDGRPVVVASRQVLLRSQDGEPIAILEIGRHISESIGGLAAGIAHHFNNLLAIIIGNAGLALEDCSTCENMRSILTAAERAAELTKQLLVYAGNARLISGRVNLTDLLTNSAAALRASLPKRVRLEFAPAAELPSVQGDSSHIREILMALVANAAEAISEGAEGLVTISTRVTPGPHVCLEVRDNGSGMDDTTKARIFEPFFTTGFMGRGLGMAYVHGIVRAHRGFIEVDSAPGAGSTFRVFLPAERNGLAHRPALIEPQAAAPAPATILIVDDEEMLRKMVAAILRRQGYQVLQAADGKEALDLLADSGVRPPVILLDLLMPGMNGHDLLPVLEAQYPEAKVIIASGYSDLDTDKSLPSKLITGILHKPFTGDDLIGQIKQALDQANTARKQCLPANEQNICQP